jgi:hypothetical protein
VDLDSTAELLAKDEHTNLAGFPSIAPIINNRKYLFGSRRNGEQILANFQFESQTSPKNPPANTPSI